VAFTGVQVTQSSLSGVRSIVDVIFSFRDRATDVVDKHYVRVDVTEMHPFLVSKLSPYYER
jgi:PatG C-terminal